MELQRLRPLSNHAVARPGHVVPLILEQVVAPGSVAVTVERHRRTGTSCGGKQRQTANQPTELKLVWSVMSRHDLGDAGRRLQDSKLPVIPVYPALPIVTEFVILGWPTQKVLCADNQGVAETACGATGSQNKRRRNRWRKNV